MKLTQLTATLRVFALYICYWKLVEAFGPPIPTGPGLVLDRRLLVQQTWGTPIGCEVRSVNITPGMWYEFGVYGGYYRNNAGWGPTWELQISINPVNDGSQWFGLATRPTNQVSNQLAHTHWNESDWISDVFTNGSYPHYIFYANENMTQLYFTARVLNCNLTKLDVQNEYGGLVDNAQYVVYRLNHATWVTPDCVGIYCEDDTWNCTENWRCINGMCGYDWACCGDGIWQGHPNEECDNDSPCCVNCKARVGELCRPLSGECDVEEYCLPSGSCPGDTFLPANTNCTDDDDPCTADICQGTGECMHINRCANVSIIPTTFEEVREVTPDLTTEDVLVISILVPLLFIMLVLMVIVLILYLRKRKRHPPVELSLLNEVNLRDIEVKERLGGGEFGDVFKGMWQKTTIVALKKLKDTSNLESFSREAMMLKSLSHPHIVQFLGLYKSPEEDQYIVTEYMSPGSLPALLKTEGRNLSFVELLEMAQHAAAGMNFLEQKNIIHRDLALRNLLVSSQDNNKYLVKVADFGLARLTGEEGVYHRSERLLPVKWTAPEALEYGLFSSKSDVWSFGVVLWELLSYGKIPYTGMSNKEVAEFVISGKRMDPPSNCPEALAAIMKKCWSQRPEDRPSFQEVFSEIQQIFSDESTLQSNRVVTVDEASHNYLVYAPGTTYNA